MHDMSLERTSLDEVLSSLGALLASRREAYGLLVVGGSNLLLLGLIDRPTGDLDVIGLSEQSAYRKVVELPEPLRRAAAEVGLAFDLSERWLNAQRGIAYGLRASAGMARTDRDTPIWRSRTAPHVTVRSDLFQALGCCRCGTEEQTLR